MSSHKRKRLSVQMIFRYGIVGVINTLAYAAAVVVLVEVFNIDPVISSVIGFIISLLFSYFLNYSWTFESSKSHNDALPKYIITSVIGLVLSTGIMYTMVDVLELWYFYGVIVATICVPLFNFTIFYLWAFAPKHSQ